MQHRYSNPYIKVTGWLFVYICVPKDLAYHYTEMILIYSVASHKS